MTSGENRLRHKPTLETRELNFPGLVRLARRSVGKTHRTERNGQGEELHPGATGTGGVGVEVTAKSIELTQGTSLTNTRQYFFDSDLNFEGLHSK